MLCLNKQDKEEQRRAAEAKKTDAVSPDDDVGQETPMKTSVSKSQLEVEEQEEDEAETSGGELDTEAPNREVN